MACGDAADSLIEVPEVGDESSGGDAGVWEEYLVDWAEPWAVPWLYSE